MASLPDVDLLASAPRDDAGLLGFIDRHRMAGLAARTLAGKSQAAPFAADLQIRQRRSAARALRHAAATVRLVRHLQAAGIDSIPLKGAVLSQELYGDPAVRDVRDADLLIRLEHLRTADQTLLASGYERLWPCAALAPPHSRAWRHLTTRGYHFEYRHHAEAVNVELHWRIPRWSGEAVERIWNASSCRAWCGGNVRMLVDRELLLLLLCDHGAHHHWFLLKWLVDVAVLLRQTSEAEASRLARLASDLDLKRPLGQAVLLTAQLFGEPVAAPLRALTHTPESQWLAAQARRCIESPTTAQYFAEARSLAHWPRLRRYERQLRTRPSTPWRLAPRLGDIATYALPDRWFWLYYPLRPVLWLGRQLTS